MTAKCRTIGDQPPVLDAIRPLQDQRQRQIGQRFGLAVAGKRGQVHRLSSAIDPALGPGHDVDPARRCAARNAAIRQVKSAGCQIKKDKITVRPLGQQCRCGARLACPRIRPA